MPLTANTSFWESAPFTSTLATSKPLLHPITAEKTRCWRSSSRYIGYEKKILRSNWEQEARDTSAVMLCSDHEGSSNPEKVTNDTPTTAALLSKFLQRLFNRNELTIVGHALRSVRV